MNLLPDAKYVFLFAHPDDDVLIAGTMKSLLQKSAEVHAAWVTSGDYFGTGKRREAELLEAATILGLPDDRRHLLRVPDLHLLSLLGDAAERVAKVFSRINPDFIFVTAFEGGHPDHDAANFLVYEGCRRAGIRPSLFEFPLYNGTGSWKHWWWRINSFPPGGAEVMYSPLDENSIRCKYRMMRAYSSQWMYMIPARLACPWKRLLDFGEPFRACPPDRDHAARPHPGRLNYERWFCAWMRTRFDDFSRAVNAARSGR